MRPVVKRWGRGALELVTFLVATVVLACAETPELDESPESAPPLAPVQVEAGVDRAVATTGDIITYTVRVEHDPGYEVDLPEPGAEIAGFRVVDLGREPVREARGRTVEERWYKLRADLVGSYVLPPLTVTYRPRSPEADPGDDEPVPQEAGDESRAELGETTLETSEIFVEVESVLPADGEVTDIRDLKPLRPLEEGWGWRWWLGVGGGALALVLGALGLVYWRRREPPEVPPIPPHELAFQALDELRRTDFQDHEALRRYYFDLSQVLRAYVEGRFGLNATDLTTEEILAAATTLPRLANGQSEALRRFLVDTDAVKFAAHVPSSQEIEETYERALSFVEATRPVAVMPETAAPGVAQTRQSDS